MSGFFVDGAGGLPRMAAFQELLMENRSLRRRAAQALCVTLVMSSPGVQAQPAAARATAAVDLDARFEEVRKDPQQTEALFKVGRKVAAVCMHCHGEGGNSIKPDIPNLAGQNPSYLFDQMRQFTDGRRRNTFMEGMIRSMSADEKIGMALFYAAQPVVPAGAGNASLVAKGQAYYGKVCFRCHGTDGRGNERMARIAGQQPVYLMETLKRYRAGSGTRINALMASNTQLMTDAEMEAIVAYVSSMP